MSVGVIKRVDALTRDRTAWTSGVYEGGRHVSARSRRAYDETNRYHDGHLPHREDYSIRMTHEESPSAPVIAAEGLGDRWPRVASVGHAFEPLDGFVKRRSLSHQW